MKEIIVRILAVAGGGAVGAVARLVIGTQIGRLNYRFPLGTFVINITGCFFLGWFTSFALKHSLSDVTRLAIGVGFVGAYTTFSTFIFESNRLADEGAIFQSLVNLIGSLVVGLIAVRLGMMLARWT